MIQIASVSIKRFICRAGAMLHGFEGKRIYCALACLRVRCVFEKVP